VTHLTRSALRFLAFVAVLASAAPARAQTAIAPPPQAATAKPPNLVADVRGAIAKGDFAGAEQLIATYRTAKGTTPEALEALSWLGRGALAARQLDRAENYALETYDLCVEALQTRKMDDEPRLPIAIGAAIEVRAHVHAERGARADAVYLLQQELAAYRTTSIRTRIQKNINLLSLEGKPAPALDTAEYLGTVAPGAVAALKGKPVVLFFWAHWCPDCKNEAPILKTLLDKYKGRDFTIVAPTQRYGYAVRGTDASPEEEKRHIEQVRQQYYSFLPPEAVQLASANHLRYGVSTTPTMVVLDRQGIVRAYRPGNMSQQDLETLIDRYLARDIPTASR
jgi:thiol-disulfide isomerase/thioredoxin